MKNVLCARQICQIVFSATCLVLMLSAIYAVYRILLTHLFVVRAVLFKWLIVLDVQIALFACNAV